MDERLLVYLGIHRNEKAIESARSLWDEARALAQVHTWERRISLEDFSKTFYPFVQASIAVTKLLECAVDVYLFAASIGDDLENRAKKYLADKKAFNGFILDRMGSYLVEQEIRKMDLNMERSAGLSGYSVTRRYSPGYQDFSIDAQKVFAELIGTAIPDLRLLDSGMIVPEKTVTALKGVCFPGVSALSR